MGEPCHWQPETLLSIRQAHFIPGRPLTSGYGRLMVSRAHTVENPPEHIAGKDGRPVSTPGRKPDAVTIETGSTGKARVLGRGFPCL